MHKQWPQQKAWEEYEDYTRRKEHQQAVFGIYYRVIVASYLSLKV